MTRFGVFVIMGDSEVDASGCADETMGVPMHMHNGFPTGKMEQTIMTSHSDVMRISHTEKGGSYKRSAQQNLGAVVTVVWGFWYKAFGLVSKPQTLYLSCHGALQ